MDFAIFTVGGTIDKTYAHTAGTYNFEVSDPTIAHILSNANIVHKYSIESICRKDSLDMHDADRDAIYNAVQRSPAKRILITHGTDTMTLTAEKLHTLEDKTIVLTGAAVPERFYESDAPFNIGFAVAACLLLPTGTYIAMNGDISMWNEVRKEKETGQFLKINSQ